MRYTHKAQNSGVGRGFLQRRRHEILFVLACWLHLLDFTDMSHGLPFQVANICETVGGVIMWYNATSRQMKGHDVN